MLRPASLALALLLAPAAAFAQTQLELTSKAADELSAAKTRLKSVYDSRMREYLEFDIARADLDSLGTLAESPTRIHTDRPHQNVPTGSKR